MKRSPRHKSQSRLLGMTYVYCMSNFPYLLKSKFGITDSPTARVSNVSETTSGTAFFIFHPFKLMYGYWFEQIIHALYFFVNAPFKKGSGRTEWFINANPILAGLAYYYSDITPVAWYWILVTPLIWVEGYLWMIVFLLANVVLILAFLCLLLYAAIHV